MLKPIWQLQSSANFKDDSDEMKYDYILRLVH